MGYESEIDAIVSIALRDFGGEGAQKSTNRSHLDLAVKIFRKQFPTKEAQQAFVDIFVRRNESSRVQKMSSLEAIEASLKYWFEVIWPHLPQIRSDADYQAYLKSESEPLFVVGQLVEHRRFGYRGVVVDVDRIFQGTEDWYETVALSRPPKNRPWYHILVNESDQMNYVAERHIRLDNSRAPIAHALIAHFFEKFEEGRYHLRGH